MLASGKSSVCKRLEKLGAYKVDADKLGHLAYAPETMDNKEGPAYKSVIQHFGRDVLDEEELFVDRKKLGAKGKWEERMIGCFLIYIGKVNGAEEDVRNTF